MEVAILVRKTNFQYDRYAPKSKNWFHNRRFVAKIQILSLNLSSKICFFLDFLKILLKKEQ